MASGEEPLAPARSSALRGAAAIGLGVALTVLAFLTAPAATLVSRMCLRNGPVTLPYGLVLGVAASMSVVLLARAVSRLFGFTAAVAWVVALFLVMKGTSGGGFLVADDALGWSFLVLATVAVLGSALVGSRP